MVRLLIVVDFSSLDCEGQVTTGYPVQFMIQNASVKRRLGNNYNKTKVIRADLLDFYFDFEDIYIKIDEEQK